jgi:hypothetical protein
MTDSPRTASGGAGTVVRRIIVFAILFALVVVGAVGLSGLIDRIIGADQVVADDQAGLARALAFTFIGIPLAGVLWWWQRRRLRDPAERASLVWALYLTAMTLTSLIVATVALATAANAGIDGQWRSDSASTALVWTGVWVWHRHMRRSAVTAPTRLTALPIELSALWGLIIGTAGAIGALASLISKALSDPSTLLATSQHWATPVLQSLVWCVIGAVVWWWHWFREQARDAPGAFAGVLLVIVVGAAAATTLFALGTVLYVVLRLVFDTAPFAEAAAPLDTAVAAALIGGVVWVYHGEVVATRSDAIRGAGRLVVSAVALIGAASGFGVVINALLAAFASAIVDQSLRALLLGGISALVVGAVAWWLAWRPLRMTQADAANPARRVYLVVIFGASAVVALVTLLILGYRIFEFALGVSGGGLLEQIRAPLGLLCAAALVFGYHFAIWRHDRAVAPQRAARAIGRVILVASGDTDAAVAAIRSSTGASVAVWAAADPAAVLGEGDLPVVLETLSRVTAARVLVVAEAGGPARVTPLAG